MRLVTYCCNLVAFVIYSRAGKFPVPHNREVIDLAEVSDA